MRDTTDERGRGEDDEGDDAEYEAELELAALGAACGLCGRRCGPTLVWHTIAPPTGTRKFLSIDCTTASTRPLRDARSMASITRRDCTPYALLTTWATPNRSHSSASPTTSSAPRGAKQLVTLSTQSTLPGPPSCSIRSSTAATSVLSASDWPAAAGCTMLGCRPAAVMHLMHVFWSMRGSTTYPARPSSLCSSPLPLQRQQRQRDGHTRGDRHEEAVGS